MTVWRLNPIAPGARILARVYAGPDRAGLVYVGDLTLRREEYGDLAARLGTPLAFETSTGYPLPIESTSAAGRPVAEATERVENFVRCTYAQTAFCSSPCRGPVDSAVVYRSQRSGVVLDQAPVCRGHAPEAVARAQAAGSTARVSVEPLSTDDDLHEGLHPQPGQPPAAPVPPEVEGWAPGHGNHSPADLQPTREEPWS